MINIFLFQYFFVKNSNDENLIRLIEKSYLISKLYLYAEIKSYKNISQILSNILSGDEKIYENRAF